MSSLRQGARAFDELASLASVLCPHASEHWFELPLDHTDSEAPRGKPRTGFAREVRGLGFIVLGVFFNEYGVNAVLLDTRSPPAVIARKLVHARGRGPVCFEDFGQAANALEASACSGGALAANWDWDPPIDLPVGGWRPRRLETWQRMAGFEIYELAGSSARWVVETCPFGGYQVRRNGRVLRNPARKLRLFQQAGDAQRFCEQQDLLAANGVPEARSQRARRR